MGRSHTCIAVAADAHVVVAVVVVVVVVVVIIVVVCCCCCCCCSISPLTKETKHRSILHRAIVNCCG